MKTYIKQKLDVFIQKFEPQILKFLVGKIRIGKINFNKLLFYAFEGLLMTGYALQGEGDIGCGIVATIFLALWGIGEYYIYQKNKTLPEKDHLQGAAMNILIVIALVLAAAHIKDKMDKDK